MWYFWGMFHTIETTTMEYLIAILALNLMNQKTIWNQIWGSYDHFKNHSLTCASSVNTLQDPIYKREKVKVLS